MDKVPRHPTPSAGVVQKIRWWFQAAHRARGTPQRFLLLRRRASRPALGHAELILAVRPF